MLNLEDLINNIKVTDKIEEYLLGFLTASNFKDYQISSKADKNQVKAIKTMFTSKKSLNDRVEAAFSYDPFCVEAMFTYLMISEDVYLQLRFDAYFNELSNYPNFSEYNKECYLKILDLYVDFLLDVNNVTKAIVVEKTIIKLTNVFSEIAVSKLAYAYFTIEDDEEFYRLYCEGKFDASAYILCIVTLLKHDEELKAQEVLFDMFKNIEYATYLDHVWDLDDNDPKQKEFADTVNDCYEEMKSIPTFFSWVNRKREKFCK